jgi:hypothetical protein
LVSCCGLAACGTSGNSRYCAATYIHASQCLRVPKQQLRTKKEDAQRPEESLARAR